MSRMPFVIAATVMATGLAWTVHLIVAPDPWPADSALAIAIGALVLSIVAMAGLLLEEDGGRASSLSALSSPRC